MSNQLYINGKPASLGQRIATAIIAVASLLFFAFFGVAIFLIGLAVALVFGGYFWWKMRKVRKQVEATLRQAQTEDGAGSFNHFYGFTNRTEQKTTTQGGDTQEKGKLYEGEYREL